MAAGKNPAKASGNGKGVAIAKRAKIDAAQKNMLVAVCIASIILGITVVGAIYLVKKINFNVLKISENDKVIENFKSSQQQLQNLSAAVSDLASNERLEVVAGERSNTKCSPEMLKNVESEEGYDLEDIEIVRTCSALRAIADTLPSTGSSDAANSSLNWLIIHNDKDIMLEGISGSDSVVGGLVDENGEPVELSTIGTNVSIKDDPSKVNRAITAIESSIRNFDIASVSISWSDYERGRSKDSEIEFNAVFRSYYSGKVEINKQTKVICADEQSEKCSKAKGSNTL